MGAAGIDGFTRAWSEPSQLERVTNWAARGCTMAELAHNMGINPDTLYRWCHRHPELDKAIRDGRAMSVEAIEDALFRSALGLDYEESEVTEVEQRPDGTQRKHVRKVRTKVRPSVAAQIFYLKNRAGYRDNPPEAPQADAGVPEDPLSAALAERARGLDDGA
ncbi:MAG: helix-turn-helix domain-containing protein [Parafannyhessea sp.]|uniref:helix-turn-helix domain-containing protein n=1 Tax=Parafannyhessea sp. TaxID=2847324 RepID=UPI003F024D8B